MQRLFEEVYNKQKTYNETARSRLTFSEPKDPLSRMIQAKDKRDYRCYTYSSELGIHLTTNELGTEKICETLSQSVAPKKTCHIGVSGWYNLDVIAIRRPE